jgi:hypothetical protein
LSDDESRNRHSEWPDGFLLWKQHLCKLTKLYLSFRKSSSAVGVMEAMGSERIGSVGKAVLNLDTNRGLLPNM